MNFKLATLCALLVFASLVASAQLDTKHWVPPFYAKPGPDSGTQNMRKHFVSLSTPSEDTIPVTIRNGFGEVIQVLEISRDMPKEYTFQPLGNATTGAYPLNVIPTDSLNTPIRSQGLYFESYQPFFVNIRHKSGYQGFSLTSKGQVGLGRKFFSGHVYTTYNETIEGDMWNNERRSHFISVMATEDNTTITFDMLTPPIELIGHPGEESVTVTLDAFESYVVGVDHSLYDNSTINRANGTRITSDKPIITNTGSWLSGNQLGQCIGADQIVPAANTGREYVVVRGLGDETTEKPMIVATEDGTEVYVNDETAPSAVLDEGEYFVIPTEDFSANGNMYIHTTKKVYMYQTMSGSSTKPGPTVDMIFVPPLNCVGAKRVVLPFVNSLSGGTGQGQINIITKSGTSVYVNESPTPITGAAEVIGNSEWVTYSFIPPTESVVIESDSVMNVALTTRDDEVGSAGYFSGFTIEPVVGLSSGLPDASPCVPGNALLQVYGFDSYQWYFNGEPIPGETNSSIVPEFSGVYTVEGIDVACGYRFMSNEFDLPLCSSSIGAAKDDQVVEETEPGSKIFDVTYRIFMENFASSVGENLQIIENIEWGLPVGATAELIGSPVAVLGSFSGGFNPNFDGINDKRLLPGNGSLPGLSLVAVDLIVRVDMNDAEQDGYINQVVITTKDEGINNGVDGPFSSQDYSNHGTDVDPNGNGEPNEDGENNPTITCFFTNEIAYSQTVYCGGDGVREVIQQGVNQGLFAVDAPGLELDSLTGAITPALSEPGTYVVTLTTEGRCPTVTTAEVTIVEELSSGTAPETVSLCVGGESVNPMDYLVGADASGDWQFADGSPLNGDFHPDEAGNFTITYVVDNGICGVKTTDLNIEVLPLPDPGTPVSETVFCVTEESVDLFSLLEGEDPDGIWQNGEGEEINPVFEFNQSGTFEVSYTVSNEPCGNHTVTFEIHVEDVPDAGLALEGDFQCPNAEIHLFDFLLGGDRTGLWHDSEGGVTDSILSVESGGVYDYAYVVEGEKCASDTAWIQFQVPDLASPGEGPEGFVDACPGDPVIDLFDLLEGADPGGVWTREDGTVLQAGLFDAKDLGVFTFTYTQTDELCGESHAKVEFSVTLDACHVPGLRIPQGFSPNADGVGDYWVIQGLSDYPRNKLVIFNRWGNKVYTASPYLNDWDGTSATGLGSGEILPVGTYWYILEPGDGEEPRTGYIYLNR